MQPWLFRARMTSLPGYGGISDEIKRVPDCWTFTLPRQQADNMERNKKIPEPDNTAVRAALWRAMHVQIDSAPHIIEDEIGFKLVAPGDAWRQRPDMNPDFTNRLRASMVARARFIEDLVIERSKRDMGQYVILGAGLDRN